MFLIRTAWVWMGQVWLTVARQHTQTTTVTTVWFNVAKSWLVQRSMWHHFFLSRALPASNEWEEDLSCEITKLFQLRQKIVRPCRITRLFSRPVSGTLNTCNAVFLQCCTAAVNFSETSEYFFHFSLLLACLRQGIIKRRLEDEAQYGKGSSFLTGWALTLWNAWQNFSILHGAWGHFQTVGGRGSNNYSYTIQLPAEKSKLTVYPQPTICRLVSCAKSNPGVKSWPRKLFFFFPSSPSFSSQAQRVLGKSSITSLRQPADFHPGGEEWEECIDVWKQTTALCVPERPDMRRNEPWDNQARNTASPHTCIM